MSLRIGIFAGDSHLGSGGGTDVYTRSLLNALADHAVQGAFAVLSSEDAERASSYRRWPSHIHFVKLNSVEPRQSIAVRAHRRLRRSFRLPVAAHYGDAYLKRQIDELHLDVIHFPSTVIQPLSVSTPCILTFFDLQQEYYPEFFTKSVLESRARTYRASTEKARHLIVPSEYTRQTLIEKYHTPASKMTYVPVGIGRHFGRATPSAVERVRNRFGLPDEFIFYPANPWPHKNHARLMAALRLYRDRWGESVPLVLTGRLSDETRDFMSPAIAAGVENAVQDLGFVPPDDLPALYSAARMMVFPSLFEGFGIPLIEAMACGCPIAAANATAIPECVGDAALLFDPFSPEDIADAIRRLWTNADLRESLTQRGYEQVERYRWEHIVPQIIEVYERAARSTTEGAP